MLLRARFVGITGLLGLIFLFIPSSLTGQSTLRTFSNKAAFLSATGATSATGPLPARGRIPGGQIVPIGSIRLSTPSREMILGPSPFDWSPLLPGNDLAISESENLDVGLTAPVNSFGFDFHEPTAPGSGSGTCGDTVCPDSTFQVTLFSTSTQVGSFTFNASNNVAAFIGVQSTAQFNRVEIREIVGGIDDEFFGQFYTVLSCGSAAPDLTATIDSFTVRVPPTIAWGQPLTPGPLTDTNGWWAVNLQGVANVTIRNIGCLDAPPTVLFAHLRRNSATAPLCANGACSPATGHVSLGGIPANGTVNQTVILDVPGGNSFDWTFVGDVFLGMAADATSLVAESDETNNNNEIPIVLADPRPLRIIPPRITLAPGNTIPNDFPSLPAAESILRLLGYYDCEIPGLFDAGWTRDLTGPPIQSRRDGTHKTASAFRVHAGVEGGGSRVVISFKGNPGFGEPNPCGFFHWDPNFINGYVETWHDYF
jgi:hypothetical protein